MGVLQRRMGGPVATHLGREGGKARTPAKAAAAGESGKLEAVPARPHRLERGAAYRSPSVTAFTCRYSSIP